MFEALFWICLVLWIAGVLDGVTEKRSPICCGCGKRFVTEQPWSLVESCPECSDEVNGADYLHTTPSFTEHLLRKHYGRKRTLEDRYLAEVAANRMGVITRLREALNELERWTGQAMPDHVARILQPGDLYDLDTYVE